jgi:hypothetical protein
MLSIPAQRYSVVICQIYSCQSWLLLFVLLSSVYPLIDIQVGNTNTLPAEKFSNKYNLFNLRKLPFKKIEKIRTETIFANYTSSKINKSGKKTMLLSLNK